MDTKKQRIIQELVPGKQITLAHIIANPDATLYEKLHFPDAPAHPPGAIGIFTVTPPETAVILADIAIKAAGVTLSSVDRTSGSLLITGKVAEAEAAAAAILLFAEEKLGFEVCKPTKT